MFATHRRQINDHVTIRIASEHDPVAYQLDALSRVGPIENQKRRHFPTPASSRKQKASRRFINRGILIRSDPILTAAVGGCKKSRRSKFLPLARRRHARTAGVFPVSSVYD